jgi:hypothetical protein
MRLSVDVPVPPRRFWATLSLLRDRPAQAQEFGRFADGTARENLPARNYLKNRMSR